MMFGELRNLSKIASSLQIISGEIFSRHFECEGLVSPLDAVHIQAQTHHLSKLADWHSGNMRKVGRNGKIRNHFVLSCSGSELPFYSFQRNACPCGVEKGNLREGKT